MDANMSSADIDKFLSPRASLGNGIIDNLALSQFCDEGLKKYVPEGIVEMLVTREAIEEEVQICRKTPDFEPLVSWIEREAKKVFAISVAAGLEGAFLFFAMHRFRELGISDGSGEIPIVDSNNQQNGGHAAFQDSRIWNRTKSFNFCEWQWRFYVPVFTKDVFLYNLEHNRILPFKSVSSHCKEGTFGKVFEAEIHPAHHAENIFNVSLPSSSSVGRSVGPSWAAASPAGAPCSARC